MMIVTSVVKVKMINTYLYKYTRYTAVKIVDFIL